ncbi:alanine racemase [Gordonia jinhuaensis]|uniref:Alanine racemase n=1 Tax=Gordonia jinhuaensis TaxID=1517702 RepID=A0A916STP6_9ACTN|nr:alanine racemase [Gordonia jinhuaensis]GGB17524.1 alanine racemase [Gordonia jinhuaensis]
MLHARIDLGAVAHNIGVLRDRSGADVMAVVKADGYGHGAAPVARAALAAGACAIGTATLPEALALREAGIGAPITCWLLSSDLDFGPAIDADIEVAVSSPRVLASVIDAAHQSGKTARVGLKIDTGLGRSGVAPDEWETTRDLVAKAVAEESISFGSLMSHLARGDEVDHRLNDEQVARLDQCRADLGRLGVAPTVEHIANSPAALARPDLARDMVRPGLAVYGRTPLPHIGDFGLIPAMTLTAEVILVKHLARGSGVSYNHTWVTPRDTTIAILPAGYADGVPRAIAGKFAVSINGRMFPSVGRVCMDQVVVDLGPDGGGVGEGDRAELFGTGADGGATALDWANASDTIDYEIISGIRGRRVRTYIDDPVDRRSPAHRSPSHDPTQEPR